MEAQQATPAGSGLGSRRHDGADRMKVALETRKIALVEKAVVFAHETLDPTQWAMAEGVIAEFYEHVPPADVAERSPRDLCGAALSLWRFAERRRQGQAKIRVFDPSPNADG